MTAVSDLWDEFSAAERASLVEQGRAPCRLCETAGGWFPDDRRYDDREDAWTTCEDCGGAGTVSISVALRRASLAGDTL